MWLWGLLVLGLLLALPTAGSAATLNVTNGGFENGYDLDGSERRDPELLERTE
ncbi:hypothetical protein [Paenibacillus sp. LjRoot153]|uniref:hypothetical protein n=1 Tax=Paenibacillus sp. LjRoot153 TaxID=3342270 RepID=UPI003F504063